MYYKSVTVFFLAGAVAAKTIDVQVGAKGLTFEPESVTAEKGDVVNFKVFEEHNVAQSSFESPCKPSGSDAIYSGYKQDTFEFAVTVNSTDPIWLYCGSGPHCQMGMVFAINPSTDKTVEMYAQKAKNAGFGVNPADVQGGVIKESEGGSQASNPSSTSQQGGASPTESPPPKSSTGDAESLTVSQGFAMGLPFIISLMGAFFT